MNTDHENVDRLRKDATAFADRWNNLSIKQLLNEERGLSRECALLESACTRYRMQYNGACDPDLEESRTEYAIRLGKVRDELSSRIYAASV